MNIKLLSMNKLLTQLRVGESAIVVAKTAASVSSVTSRLRPAVFEQQAVMIVIPGDTECLRAWIVTRKYQSPQDKKKKST